MTHWTPAVVPLYDPRHDHDACGVGFVAQPRVRERHRTVPMALEALAALSHRGALAADNRTGDGAGIALPISVPFRARVLREAGVAAVAGRRLAIGMCFVPPAAQAAAHDLIAERSSANGLVILGWRDVPVDSALTAGRRVGETPLAQMVVVAPRRRTTGLAFARALAAMRRSVDAAAARDGALDGLAMASLSESTVVYKGLFVGDELGRFYADLRADDMQASYATFHQRYSTNTFPSWRLAQPFGYLAHNGEINTVRANREAMRGRRRDLGRAAWARRLADAGPLVSPDGSDSLSLDHAVELLVLAGLPVDSAVAQLVPAAAGLLGEPERMSAVEPWDGPAALVFADGRRVGAATDRNGLRPLAVATTREGTVVVSSEAGSVELDSASVTARWRLGPGEMLVIDTTRGEIVGPRPTVPPRSLDAHALRRPPSAAPRASTSGARERVALGLDAETLRQIIRPMATTGHEATWSMGDDTPVAVLAGRPRRVTAHLRQSFAQVTNPAIDPERERAVMSLGIAVGRQPSLLGSEAPVLATLDAPVVGSVGWSDLIAPHGSWTVVMLDATWAADRGPAGLSAALRRLARQALAAARRRTTVLALSDRGIGPRRAPVPSVLAVGSVHAALTAAGLRSRTDIIVEAGDCLDVHDTAMLLAAGASAIHPWLLLELAEEHAGSRGLEHLTPEMAGANVITALEAGLRKVLARMGISTLASYRGGQLFDAVGLDRDLVQRCFPAAGSWPGGVGTSEVGRTVLARHRRAWTGDPPPLEDPGLVRFRAAGEAHAFAPRVVRATQELATGVAFAADASTLDAALGAYREEVQALGQRQPRHLLRIRPVGAPVPLDEVEPARRIVRRFVGSAMSLGALSPEAHQAISIGMARLGAAANSGEGGEDPAWYADAPDGKRRDAAIKQVASARFGVTAEYLARAEQLEIKISQGSKPGEGGQLPGRKATAFIAGLRRGQPGMTMISPPPHHDIYSIEDLAQLIADLRAVNPRARVGVKLVAGVGVGTIAAGVAKAHADYVMVSGHSGGTGASPLSSIKNAGLPWELGLAEAHQVLVRNRLRDRVTLRTDGGLQTGRDVVMAAVLGAEEYGFGTAALVAIGCDMARQCHLDTCPTGIATQREDLRAKFTGTPDQVVAFFTAIAEDVRRELAALGVRSLGALIGRADLLEPDADAPMELDRLVGPRWAPPARRRNVPPRDRAARADGPDQGGFEADAVGVALAGVAADRPVTIRARISPRDRSIGARLAGALAALPKPRHAPRVRYDLTGSAGQSLGAFAVAGMRITVTGEANDYVGKGLSGGVIVIRPPAASRGGEAQALAGNVCLYGATGGALHVIGTAGMRFAVRNSGARAVVEGIGTHGCEYMTGGTVVVLGRVGPNFGAGMTGGRAYLLATPELDSRLHQASVMARPLTELDDPPLRELLEAHAVEGSRMAAALLADWRPDRFRVVHPRPATLGVAASQPRDEESLPRAAAGGSMSR